MHGVQGDGPCLMPDEPGLGELLDDFPESDSLVGERFAQVLVEGVPGTVLHREFLALVAEGEVQHATAHKAVQGRFLHLLLQYGGVCRAGVLEGEFPGNLFAHHVFYFYSVLGACLQGGIHKVPVPGGVCLFCPQQFRADFQHVAVGQGVLDFFVGLLFALPQSEPADRHGIFFGMAAVVGNLYRQVGLLLFPARVFHAALVQGFGTSDGHVVFLPDCHAENLGIQGVTAIDSVSARRNHVVLALADFQVQVGVPDAGTTGKCQGVALLVGSVRFQGDVVALFAELLCDIEAVQLAETALVGKDPGLAAFALEEHHLAVKEGGDPDFFDLAVFGSVDDPTLFHKGGVVHAGVVAGAAVLAEGGGEVGVFLEGGIDGLCGSCEACRSGNRKAQGGENVLG